MLNDHRKVVLQGTIPGMLHPMEPGQVEVAPPFAGPVTVQAPRRGLGTVGILVSCGLAGLGLGFGVAAYRRMRRLGKLYCALELLDGETYGMPVVGVNLGYEGDWWKDRGERLYWQARNEGATTAEGIGTRMIAADIGASSACMEQFPPHANTHPQNVELWDNLMTHVQSQMAKERELT